MEKWCELLLFTCTIVQEINHAEGSYIFMALCIINLKVL